MAMANIIAGAAMVASKLRSKPPPREKKNRIRKKSRKGFRFSAMYCAIGLVASEMPAIKAPISLESPITSANSAIPKHQPIVNKIYIHQYDQNE